MLHSPQQVQAAERTHRSTAPLVSNAETRGRVWTRAPVLGLFSTCLMGGATHTHTAETQRLMLSERREVSTVYLLEENQQMRSFFSSQSANMFFHQQMRFHHGAERSGAVSPPRAAAAWIALSVQASSELIRAENCGPHSSISALVLITRKDQNTLRMCVC